jgi:hypothetical protein
MKVYQTSKGTFLFKAIAEMKKNRETFGFKDPIEWEPVREAFVLSDGSNFFALTRLELKVS